MDNQVIVLGSINMDIVAIVDRFPNIGETIFGNNLQYLPGGKGLNQAIASSKLGARTTIIGKVGNDKFGDELIGYINNQGVINNISIDKNAPTGVAIITLSETNHNNTIIVIKGANFELKANDIDFENFSKGDILISQFEVPIDLIIEFFKKGKKFGTTNILNPSPAEPIKKELLSLVDILILNESELNLISGINFSIDDKKSISLAVEQIRKNNNLLSVIVTLGEKGAIGFNGKDIYEVDAFKVNVIDTTGAGDCFTGAFASKYIENNSMKDCIEFANLASSICVTRQGASVSMPSLEELH